MIGSDEQDATVERVLAALGDVEPPNGIERRILAAVEGRSTAPHRIGLRASGLRMRSMPGLLLCGAVLLLIAGLASMRKTSPDHNTMVGHLDASRTLTTPAAKDVPLAGAVGVRRQLRTPLFQLAAAPSEPREAVAQDASLRFGYPPPPMPLTEQERLLLDLAHRRAERQLAVLNPVLLKAHEYQEQAEFDEFFAPPIMPEPQPIPSPTDQGEKR